MEVEEDVPVKLMRAACDWERLGIYMRSIRVHRIKKPMYPQSVPCGRLLSQFSNLQQICGHQGERGSNYYTWTIERDGAEELSLLSLNLEPGGGCVPGWGICHAMWGAVSSPAGKAPPSRLKSLILGDYERSAYNFSRKVLDDTYSDDDFMAFFLPAGLDLDEDEIDFDEHLDRLAPNFASVECLVLNIAEMNPNSVTRLCRFATQLHTLSMINTGGIGPGENISEWNEAIWTIFDRVRDLSILNSLFDAIRSASFPELLFERLCDRPTSQLRRFTLTINLDEYLLDFDCLPEVPSWPSHSKLEHVTVYMSLQKLERNPSAAAHILIEMFPPSCTIEILPQLNDWPQTIFTLEDKARVQERMKRIARGVLSTRDYLLSIANDVESKRGWVKVKNIKDIESGENRVPQKKLEL